MIKLDESFREEKDIFNKLPFSTVQIKVLTEISFFYSFERNFAHPMDQQIYSDLEPKCYGSNGSKHCLSVN